MRAIEMLQEVEIFGGIETIPIADDVDDYLWDGDKQKLSSLSTKAHQRHCEVMTRMLFKSSIIH